MLLLCSYFCPSCVVGFVEISVLVVLLFCSDFCPSCVVGFVEISVLVVLLLMIRCLS